METRKQVDISQASIEQLQAMAYREIKTAEWAHKNLAAIERAIQAKEAANVKKTKTDAQADLAPQSERAENNGGDNTAVAHAAKTAG